MVGAREIFDIVELAYYVSALPLSIWVLAKHGFGRQLGWIYLTILALIRIVGASCGIAAVSNPKNTLIEINDILGSVGLSALFLAMLGFLKRL